MKAISEVMYTERGRPYQGVLLEDDELSCLIYLKDIPSDVDVYIVPFRALPATATPPAKSLTQE